MLGKCGKSDKINVSKSTISVLSDVSGVAIYAFLWVMDFYAKFLWVMDFCVKKLMGYGFPDPPKTPLIVAPPKKPTRTTRQVQDVVLVTLTKLCR